MAGFRLKTENIFWQTVIFLMVCGGLNFLYATGAFDRLEAITLDQRLHFYRGTKEIPANIVTVMIDEESLQDMAPEFGRFPWPRGVYGDLLEFFAMGGAEAVLFDILFTEPERTDDGGLSEDDRMLIDAGADFPMAYHAAQIIVDREDEMLGKTLNRPMPESFRQLFAIPGDGFRTDVHNNFFLPFNGLYQTAAGVGVVGIDPDPDGIFRRIRLFREYQGDLYPTLAIAPLIHKTPPKQIPIFTEGKIRLGPLAIPVNHEEDYLINPYGKIKQYSISGIFTSLKMIRAGDIENLLVDPAEFAGKTVLVGASAVGLEDIKATPLSAKTPGVLMQAWTMANIQEKDFLRRAPRLLTMGVVALFTLLTVIAVFYCTGFTLRAGLPLFLSLGYGYLGFSAFENNFIYDLVPPLAAIVATILASFTFLSFTEGRDKRAVRKIFSRYVSPEIMAELLDRPQDFSCGEIGRQENMTILFSDLRGFTSLSETLAAEQVVDLLNCHFSHMAEVIFAQKGTLDKFIGDAIMAFWGAPLRVKNHAELAVTAALQMVTELTEVNKELRGKGYPEVAIGIGVNTGEVILGNIGSERKMDYTVIGDNVNLASRLEGLTKQYGYPVLISENTQKELAGFPCLLVDQVRVKGKKEPVRIYAPLAANDAASGTLDQAREQCRLAEEGFTHYQAGEWQAAKQCYQGLDNVHLLEMYLTRCDFLAENPPPADWDGVCTMQTK